VRYGGAVCGVALAIVARLLLEPLLGDAYPLMTLYFAVVAIAWLAGFGPTLLATVIGAAAADLLFLQPHFSLSARPQDALGLGVFLALGLLTALLSRRAALARSLEREMAERRSADETLRASEERFRLLADGMPQIVWAARTDGFLDYFNRRWYELTGAKEGEVGDASWLPVLHPDDRQRGSDAWYESVRTGEPFQAELRFRFPATGEYRWYLGRALPVRDAQGRVVRWQGTATDIDDQKRVQTDLHESRERLQAALAASETGTFRWDIRTNALGWDESLDRLFGLPPDEAVRSLDQFLRLVHPEDRDGVIERCARCAAEGADFEMDFRVIWPDGTVRWLADRGKTHPAADGHPLYMTGACVDITERKRMEEALREADRRKDEFLATLAHELRNPLAPVRNAVQILELADSDAAALRQAREIIQRQVGQLTRLVDDLLDVSRISRGKITLRREPVSLRAAVQMAVETCRSQIESAGHALRIDLPPSDLELEADPARLAQVLSNLLSNAAKYMEPGGDIRLSAAGEGGQAVIRIRDTGVGMAADALDRIFDPFVQVDASLERSQGGLGIGLTLVRSLVELHGGTVEAHSDGLGHGSELVVRLPLASRAGASDPAGRLAEETADGGRKVLLADDNRDSAESLALLLGLYGHEVRVAYDGIAAVEVARAFRPEVALLDIGMPGLNGYEVARKLRQEAGDRPLTLVALTGWGQDGDRLRSREAGFDHHLVKPADPDALQRLLAAPANAPATAGPTAPEPPRTTESRRG
jgi:PAS domain S-box-containing protein